MTTKTAEFNYQSSGSCYFDEAKSEKVTMIDVITPFVLVSIAVFMFSTIFILVAIIICMESCVFSLFIPNCDLFHVLPNGCRHGSNMESTG